MTLNIAQLNTRFMLTTTANGFALFLIDRVLTGQIVIKTVCKLLTLLTLMLCIPVAALLSSANEHTHVFPSLAQSQLQHQDSASTVGSTEPIDGYDNVDSQLEKYLPSNRRLASHDQLATLGVQPDYHLVFSFDPPDLLTVARQASALPDDTDRILSPKIHNSPRISGWKDSNLQYRFTHADLS